MAGETILVIDAGQDIDERMTTALEAEGYLVYNISSQDVNAQLVDAFAQPGITKDKSPIYRVLVNKFEDRKAAQRMAGEIQTREQVKTTLYGD